MTDPRMFFVDIYGKKSKPEKSSKLRKSFSEGSHDLIEEMAATINETVNETDTDGGVQ